MMRSLIFIISLMGSFYANANANANCSAKYITDPNSTWSGECVNGQANGIGLLSYIFTNKNNEKISHQIFGRFNNGNWTGLNLLINGKFKYVYFFKNSNENVYVGPIAVATPENEHLRLNQQNWYDINANVDVNGNLMNISYEKALNDIKAYVAQRNEPSMDFEVFKAYLEGRVRVTGEDDPPVLGAALKPSGAKKKK